MDDEGGKDVFVHVSEMQASEIYEDPEPGTRISFELKKTRDGRTQATSIRLIGD